MAGLMLRVAVETPEDDIGWASCQEFVDAVFQRFTVDDERSIDGVERFGYILVLMRVAYNERRCEGRDGWFPAETASEKPETAFRSGPA